ncbi:TPA: hypothetical protein M4860_001683 [Salmonella enterica]|nr:hypothetical protein [Salmonella enterica]
MARSLQTAQWKYVCRTDIQGFYGHIRRGPLMRQLKRHVSDPVLLNLVRQYLHYSVERGGEFYTPQKGICRGCALSPLLAGFCLWAMDTYFEAQQPHLRYVRFMDDIVIFTRTRWHLRRAVRALNVFFASGGYRQHPDKTFIGKTEKGFDWMGIQFNRSGIGDVAPRAMANHRQRLRRLYEQTWRYGKEKTRARVGEYVRRWKIWRKYMIPKKWEWVHESTISVFVHALLRCRDLIRLLTPMVREKWNSIMSAAHAATNHQQPLRLWSVWWGRDAMGRNSAAGVFGRVGRMPRPSVGPDNVAGFGRTTNFCAPWGKVPLLFLQNLLAIVLCWVLIPDAIADVTPNCKSEISGTSGQFIYNPYPAQGNPPYMFISPSPNRIDVEQTCTPAADVEKFGLIFTNGNYGQITVNMTSPAAPRPTYEWFHKLNAAGAYTIGDGVISCEGLDGVQSANIPQDMVQISQNTIWALVPCRPRVDGTVHLSVHVGNGRMYTNRNGDATRNVNFTDGEFSAAAGTGMAALMNQELLNVYAAGSTRGMGNASYPTFSNQLQVRGVGGADGLETCDIQMPSVIDFGTLNDGDLDIADSAASVTTAGNSKTVSVVTVCQGLATATVNNGWSVTGPQSRYAGFLDSSNLGVVFGVAIVGPYGDTCYPLDAPCRRVSVGTSDASASRNVVSGTQSTRDMQLVIAPFRVPGAIPSPGRTTSYLTLNYFYPN